MSDATKDRSKAGFSSRWMLDGSERRSTEVSGSAQATAHQVDTDGDGVADTLSVRVDTQRRSFLGRTGTWIARSIVTILLVAAIVAAVAASTSLFHTRDELSTARAALATAQAETETLRRDLTTAQSRVASLEADAAGASGDATAIEAERDELELEVRVLRRMLLDAERRAATA